MYDEDFYLAEERVARASAELVIPWLLDHHPAKTVVDVGCGTGAWASVCEANDCTATGVDLGVPAHLIDPYIEYIEWDLINGYPCSGYDLAICLEVAEHLPESTGPLLIEGLAQAPTVLFSAATPGQLGVNHINCQPHDYWHAEFAKNGMTPRYIGDQFSDPVADFYRRNMFVYTKAAT